MEKTEFEFPHEVEEKTSRLGSKVVTPEAEIEVVDDTPVEDRNRALMTEAPTDPTDEELESYTESAKKRLKHFTKGYHEERRAKETAIREREEAIRAAQVIFEENKKLKGSLNQGQQALLEQAKKVVANELNDAKKQYKDAFESGDSDALVNAQEQLTTIKMKSERVNNFKPAPVKEDAPVAQIQQQYYFFSPKSSTFFSKN